MRKLSKEEEKFINEQASIYVNFIPSKADEENLRRDFGLERVFAYSCLRCNYLWFPKDYDPAEKLITQFPPPKVCARCKSKYWNKEPQRKIKSRYGASVARLRAYFRQRDRYGPDFKYH